MLVTLEEVKTYLRVDSSDDDALIEQMIPTAEMCFLQLNRRSW